jgi:DNA-binding SARP family transcriptional activator
MRFRMLGSLRVRTGATWVPVAAEQQRLVLAVLLVDAGRAVSTDRLVDAVWGVQPPRRAVNTMQAYVMRLRRLLGDDAVVTRGRGYELVAGRDDIDAMVFERLVAAGRRDLEQGRPEAGVPRLARALALWRGPVFADVPASAALAGRAAQLEQVRLAAEEDHLAALIQLGRFAETIEELQRLVDEQPLRERRWALLMQALDGCGRRGEALEAFQRARRALHDALGLEPGPQLRELQRAILAADVHDTGAGQRPTVGTHVAAGTHVATGPAAAQLPGDVVAFTGRERQLARLDAMSNRAGGESATAVVISAIAGTAGVGKTALAVRWAHRARDRFPDGQLYINLRGYADAPPVRPIEALARFLRALGVPADQVPADVDEASGLYRSLLAGRRMLVLLDNARDAEQARPLLPGSSGCLALVTSRDRLNGLVALDGAMAFSLDVLSETEARTLLVRVLGRRRVDAESAAATELVRLCGNLPLALRIAAADLSTRPHASIAEYAARLSQDRLDTLKVDGDPQAGVRAAFDLSYATLADGPRRLLRLLGLVPGPDVTAPAAAALAGTAPELASRWLARLVDAHLVAQESLGRYALHDLLRCYALERAEAEEDPAERQAAVERLYGYYLDHTYAAADLLHPEFLRLPYTAATTVGIGDLSAATAWIEAERVNLIGAVRHTAVHGPRRTAWLLADALRSCLAARMDTQDWEEVAEAGLAAAEADDDQHGITAAQISLARLHSVRGRFDDAIASYQRAAEHAKRAGWLHAEAHAQGAIGGEYQMLGKLHLAATHLSQSLVMQQELRAAAIFRGQGATTAEARANGALGIAYHTLGRLDDATASITAALSVLRDAGDRYYLSVLQSALAEVYRDRGNHADALDLAVAAVALADDIADPWQRCSALLALASVHHHRGEHGPAVTGYAQALALAREVGDEFLEADILVRLAGTHHSAGRHDAAIDLSQQALAIARQGSYPLLGGQALTVLAAAHLARGQLDAAVDESAEALRIHVDTGHRPGQAQAHLVAARALHASGDAAGARAHDTSAADLFAMMGVDPKPYAAGLLGEVSGD